MNTKKIPELLAPAGSPEALKAAIAGGADAVYLGMTDFSARRKAGNFTLDELKEALILAHRHQVKIYVTINTLIKDSEFENLNKLLFELSRTQVDGLIVQDIGLIHFMHMYYPQFSVQLSTQASVYGLAGVQFFEALRLDRVVLPREMPIEEIKEIREHTSTELKVFNHGALCYAYSGQCRFSSMFGGRSANRGACAQPCRQQYTLYKDDKQVLSGSLLSTKDLNTLSSVEALSCVDSLKIEGRMKAPEYVYAVTKAYRNKLDGVPVNEEELRAVFNRDFTTGPLFHQDHYLNRQSAKKQGIPIGRVKAVKGREITIIIDPKRSIVNGDGLSFGKTEHTGGYVNGIFSEKGEKLKEGRATVRVRIDAAPQVGDLVVKSYDKRMTDRLGVEMNQAKPAKRVLNLHVHIEAGEPVVAELESCGKTTVYRSELIPESAKNRALTEDEVCRQLKRLGNDGFEPGEITGCVAPGLFLSKSALNAIRTGAASAMNAVLEQVPQTSKANLTEADKELRQTAADRHNQDSAAGKVPLLSLQFQEIPEDLSQIPEVDEFVLPLNLAEPKTLEPILKKLRTKGTPVLVSHPKIMNTQADKAFLNVLPLLKDWYLQGLISGILVGNYEVAQLIKSAGIVSEADESLNVFNRYALHFLQAHGFKSAVVSGELSQAEAERLADYQVLPLVRKIYARQLLMSSAFCLFDCGQHRTCHDCPKSGTYHLENKQGTRFPLSLKNGLTEIYAPEPSFLPVNIKNTAFKKYRIVASNETPEELNAIIQAARSGSIPTEPYTQANYLRGVE